MEFYYENEIAQFQPKCPPEDYLQIERESFRWVFNSIEDIRNFKAQAEKNPKILNDKSDLEKCAYFALSFHRSQIESKEHFEYLIKTIGKKDKSYRQKAYERFGTNIAKGTLNISDGVSGVIEENGHFNFHHIKEHNFTEKFEILDEL